MQPKNYQDNFYEYHLQGAIKSAEKMVPLVLEYVNPVSVADIGCGIGAWLSVWNKNGVKDLLGMDGYHVDVNKLIIDKSKFIAVGLEKGFSVNKKYDLVSCLEVAEHLPFKSADTLIKSLCMASDVVLFSAAVPWQEGTLHINEQYPDYWAAIFKNNKYIPIDCLRPRIWNDKDIQWWYRQNTLFFVNEASIENYPGLKHVYNNNPTIPLSLIHPELFEYKSQKAASYESILASGKATLKYLITNFLNRKKG